MRISFIIPVRNRIALTVNILRQLRDRIRRISSEDTIDIIVVDDGSNDGTSEEIEVEFPEVFLLKGDGSLWWTGAIAWGMRYALEQLECDRIVWLNDDMDIAEDSIARLLEIARNPKYEESMVGGIILDKTYPQWIVYSGLKKGCSINRLSDFSSCGEIEVEFLCGNMVIIPRGIVEKIGFPDAKRLPQHGADFEYTWRARQRGFRAVVSSKLRACVDFQVSDFIRYMPYWMQWYFQKDFGKKLKVLAGLTSLHSNQNIWVFVNLHHKNRNQESTPFWKYVFCYLNKASLLLMTDFLPAPYLEGRVRNYLTSKNLPEEFTDRIWQLKKDL